MWVRVPKRTITRLGALLVYVAAVWSERPRGERVGANDYSPVQRPLCSVSFMHVLQGEMGEIHTCLASIAVSSWPGTSSLWKGGVTAPIPCRGAVLIP